MAWLGFISLGLLLEVAVIIGLGRDATHRYETGSGAVPPGGPPGGSADAPMPARLTDVSSSTGLLHPVRAAAGIVMGPRVIGPHRESRVPPTGSVRSAALRDAFSRQHVPLEAQPGQRAPQGRRGAVEHDLALVHESSPGRTGDGPEPRLIDDVQVTDVDGPPRPIRS